jgi:hypothetical protein
MLVPRSATYVEVWWGESDGDLRLVGVASGISSVLAIAARVARSSRSGWRWSA